MNLPWYDNPVDITERLTDLNGLHRVIRERQTAGYDRKERLHEYMVLGRWMFDTCGNCGKISLLDRDPYIAPADLVYIKEKVIALEAAHPLLGAVRIGWSPQRPPLSSDECKLCEEPWTLQNCHDAVISGEREFMHARCYRAQRANRERDRFDVLFFKAGFTMIKLDEIPNQYCSCSLCAPWYRVTTEVGPIVIGQRKSVINIDWSKTRRDLSALFRDQDVTKGPHFIHAWGDAKVETYLRQIREATAL